MNTILAFDFDEQAVRALRRDGEPWFVVADICRVLDLSNPSKVCADLDADESITLTNREGNPRAGIPHKLNLISESGLYALIFKSRKPEAKRFRKWVTAEVLPALRETGRYEVAGGVPAAPVTSALVGVRLLLLSSAQAVYDKTLDTGRAQQIANLAARYLETIKLEGDAIGYENVLGVSAGAARNGVLLAAAGGAYGTMQDMRAGGPKGEVPAARDSGAAGGLSEDLQAAGRGASGEVPEGEATTDIFPPRSGGVPLR